MKTAFITGATSGIGRAIAEAFKQRDYEVMALGRDPDRLGELEACGFHVLRTELGALDELEETIQNVKERFDRLDVLVNNAGSSEIRHLRDLRRG